MNIKFVLEVAPPTPACFPARMTWAEYLLQCQEYGKRQAARPFDAAGIYRPEFDFCADCTVDHAQSMKAAAKCDPLKFRGITVKVEHRASAHV